MRGQQEPFRGARRVRCSALLNIKISAMVVSVAEVVRVIKPVITTAPLAIRMMKKEKFFFLFLKN